MSGGARSAAGCRGARPPERERSRSPRRGRGDAACRGAGRYGVLRVSAAAAFRTRPGSTRRRSRSPIGRSPAGDVAPEDERRPLQGNRLRTREGEEREDLAEPLDDPTPPLRASLRLEREPLREGAGQVAPVREAVARRGESPWIAAAKAAFRRSRSGSRPRARFSTAPLRAARGGRRARARSDAPERSATSGSPRSAVHLLRREGRKRHATAPASRRGAPRPRSTSSRLLPDLELPDEVEAEPDVGVATPPA